MLFPVYKGTYERGPSLGASILELRDLMLAWRKDLGRSLDYLETRPDIDRERIAYYGQSLGAGAGIVLTARKRRCRVMVLLAATLIVLWPVTSGAQLRADAPPGERALTTHGSDS